MSVRRLVALGLKARNVLEWLERNLANAISPRLRHLVAFDLPRQLWHLPTPIPAVARQLLEE